MASGRACLFIFVCSVPICAGGFPAYGQGTCAVLEKDISDEAKRSSPACREPVEDPLRQDALVEGLINSGVSLLQTRSSKLLQAVGTTDTHTHPHTRTEPDAMDVDWWVPDVPKEDVDTFCCPFTYPPMYAALDAVGATFRASGEMASVAPSLVIGGIGDSGTRGMKQFLEMTGMKFCKYADLETEDNVATRASHANITEILAEGYDIHSKAFRETVISEQNAAAFTLHCILHDNELPADWMQGVDAIVDNMTAGSNPPTSLAQAHSLVWGYKNPKHAYLLPVMDAAFQKRSKYLLVARDPRDICTATTHHQFDDFGALVNGNESAQDCLLFWADLWTTALHADYQERLVVVRVEDLAVHAANLDNEVLDVPNCLFEFVGLHPEQDSVRAALRSMQEHEDSYMGKHYNFTRAQRSELEAYVASRTQPTLIHETMRLLGYNPDRYELLQPRSSYVCQRRSSHVVTVVPSGNQGFCKTGAQLPELFLLGEMKSTTSSLAELLIEAGVLPALRPEPNWSQRGAYRDMCWQEENGCTWKEFHFWDIWLSEHQFDPAKALSDMSQFLPICSSQRSVLGDFTPDYLRIAPLPEGTVVSGSHYGHGYFVNSSQSTNASQNLPVALQATYGGMLARKLQFVVALRDPLQRMQSAYYHSRAGDPAPCIDCQTAATFKEALLGSVVKAERDPPHYDDWLWTSMAGVQLQEWVKHFSADQFLIYPMQFYLQNATIICLEVAARLRAPLQCDGQLAAPVVNQHTHPALQDEGIPSALIARFNAIIEPDIEVLVRILVQLHLGGTTLMGYSSIASSGATSAMRSWLESLW